MKALLIIDMLNDFIESGGALYIGPAGEKIVPVLAQKLNRYRQAGDAVIFIADCHLAEDAEFKMFPPHCLEGSRGGEIIDALKPLPGERIIFKRRYSAFFGTDLDLTLRENNISAIEIAGVVTNICVLYTAADARMLNYQVTVDPAAVASFDQDAHHFALQEMEKTLGVNVLQTEA